MAAPTLEQWLRLWSRIGASGDGGTGWNELERRYQEPHRAYHNFDHLGHCLAEFERVRTLAMTPEAVELGLWFHDAIYDPRSSENERHSAALARALMRDAGLSVDRVEAVEALILATRHQEPPGHPDAALISDIDLAILGQPRERFAGFEEEIRTEYAWVPDGEFAAGRSAVLRGFLERPTVFATPHFRSRYELQARENLKWALQRLAAG